MLKSRKSNICHHKSGSSPLLSIYRHSASTELLMQSRTLRDYSDGLDFKRCTSLDLFYPR